MDGGRRLACQLLVYDRPQERQERVLERRPVRQRAEFFHKRAESRVGFDDARRDLGGTHQGAVVGAASPSTTRAPGSRCSTAGATRSLMERLPPPRITVSRSITAASMNRGNPSGSPNGVTPPIIIPVNSRVCSGDANDALRTPSRSQTA